MTLVSDMRVLIRVWFPSNVVCSTVRARIRRNRLVTHSPVEPFFKKDVSDVESMHFMCVIVGS